MSWLIYIPLLAFVLLLVGEGVLGRRQAGTHGVWDWVINLSGFIFQGALIPWCGYVLAARVIPAALPQYAGILAIGWWGALLLNLVFVDFLFYWQHRWFHESPRFWKLHRCHHTATRLDVWVTSRNSLLTHFLFVYLLVNPLLGYFVSRPEAFFVGAALTASLDLFRHANLDFSRIPGVDRLGSALGYVFVLPSAHHRHHGAGDTHGTYGANLIIWDRLFGTLLPGHGYPDAYGINDAPRALAQLLYPLHGPTRPTNPTPEHASEP